MKKYEFVFKNYFVTWNMLMRLVVITSILHFILFTYIFV